MGSKPAQCAYLKNGQIFSTGFSKMSERQYALWDEVSSVSVILCGLGGWGGGRVRHLPVALEVMSSSTF